jgi:HAD superfamily hydrolase (TIGR01509 family)
MTARSAGALLFDLDGTLCDTDNLHFGAYCTLLKDFGRSITLDHYKAHIMGAPNDAIMREMFPDLDVARHRELADRKEAMFREAIAALEPTRGVTALLDWADARGVGVAVVTNAPRANAEMMLKGLALDRRIGTVVLGDELERAKPDPLPYATALERLDARPDRALAFEDSLPGIRSASGAGVATYGIRTGHPDAALLGAGAIGAIDDFTDAALWRRLEAMF